LNNPNAVAEQGGRRGFDPGRIGVTKVILARFQVKNFHLRELSMAPFRNCFALIQHPSYVHRILQ